jgi:selenocysteine lyase/cysteine desulfurase
MLCMKPPSRAAVSGEKGAAFSRRSTRYTQYGIAAAPSGGIRLSPHIYNTLADVDDVVNAVQALAK